MMPRFVADYPPQAHACRLKNPVNERMLWDGQQSKLFMQLLRQCDYVLYSKVDLRKTSPSKNGVKMVDFYVNLGKGVVKSVAETIAFLEEINRSPLPELPPTPTSPMARAGTLGFVIRFPSLLCFAHDFRYL